MMRWAAMLVIAGFAAVAPAAQTVFSGSHRFAVSGLSAVDGTTLAAWADDVLSRVESATGTPVDFGAGEYIAIRALSASNQPPQVTRAQGFLDGRLQQRLVVNRPAEVDQEDVMESLCALLLDRQAIGMQPSGERAAALARVPAWMAVGLAQNLFKELRARNVKAALDLEAHDVHVEFARILELSALPPGRWREKYFCGLAVGMLLAAPDLPQRWSALAQRVAARKPVTSEWIASSYLQQTSGEGAEFAWRQWIESQKNMLQEVAGSEGKRVEQLVQLLASQPADFGVVTPKDMASPVTPRQLIEQRKEAWARKFATTAAMQIKLIALGQSPEFQEVVHKYNDFFEQLASGKKSAKELMAALSAASQALAVFQAKRQQEHSYLNSVSQWLETEQESDEAAPPLPQRDEVQRYMDGVEQSFEGR